MSTVTIITLLSLSALAVLVIDFFLAREFYKAALMKGHSEKKYFWICFLVPLAGCILVAALPDRGSRECMTAIISDDLPDM